MIELRETPHGLLGILALPGETEEIEALFAALPAEERALAGAATLKRRRTFAGGRTVLRATLAALGAPLDPATPILRDDRGAPTFGSPGVSASLSHTEAVAVALAAYCPTGHFVGVDVEAIDHVPEGAEALILTPEERVRLAPSCPFGMDDSPPARRLELALKASLKEAFYKALDPLLRRPMTWSHSEVWPRPDGTARLVALLDGEEATFRAEGWWAHLEPGAGHDDPAISRDLGPIAGPPGAGSLLHGHVVTAVCVEAIRPR